MTQVIPTSTATGSTVPLVSSEINWSMDSITPELPDARDLFEVRVRGTKTLVIIPKNSMAQGLLSDLLEHTPMTSLTLSGNGFKAGSTSWVKEATIEFKPFPKTKIPEELSAPKKTSKRKRKR